MEPDGFEWNKKVLILSVYSSKSSSCPARKTDEKVSSRKNNRKILQKLLENPYFPLPTDICLLLFRT
jgi:hypothetical protein